MSSFKKLFFLFELLILKILSENQIQVNKLKNYSGLTSANIKMLTYSSKDICFFSKIQIFF